MRRYSRHLVCCFVLACFFLSGIFRSENPAFAQQTPNAEAGFQTEGIYDSGGIDNVSLFNGALSLTIPLGIPYPAGGGFSHQIRIVYHSTLWDSFVYSSPCPSPSECPVEFRPKSSHDAGLGWRLALPRLIPPGGWNQTAAWIYVSADGGEHAFYDKLHFTDSEDSGDSGFDQLVRYTRDGTYLRFKRPSETSTTITVELPGGDIHTFSQSGGEWRLTSMKDRFGNGLDLIRDTNGLGNQTLTLDDGFRQHVVTYEDQPGFPDQPSLISRIDLAAFDGETATYSFQYATKTVFRPAAHTHPDPTDRSISVRLLQRVTLPGSNGAYVFGSVANPAYRAEGYVTQMRLPTLGYLEWDWQPHGFPKLRTLPPNQEDGEAVDPYNSVFGVSKRRQKNISGNTLGEWTYTRAFEPSLDAIGELPERLTVTVERPLGDKSEHYFSVYPAKENVGQPAPQWGTKWTEYSLPYTRSEQDPFGGDRYLSSKIFDCDENGNGCELKQAEYVAYELDDASTFNDDTGILFNKNRRQKSRRIVDHYVDADGQSQTDHRLEVSSNFDGLGHYRNTTVTSDFGPSRSSQTTFNAGQGTYPGSFQQIHKNSPWILNTFDSSSRTESGVTAKQEFCFNGSTGFLERSRTLRLGNGRRSTTDLIQSFTADSSGQITAQFWYGGDLVPVGTGHLCGLNLGNSSFRMSNTYQFGVLKTSRYTYHDGSVDGGSNGGPLTYFEIENTSIDQNTGLVETRRSPSSLTTSYDFDGLGRLRLIKPDQASGAAWTKIWFGTAQNTSSPARAEVRELPNGSVDNNDALTEKHYRWDGLGRLARERVALPASSGVQFTDRYHAYDAEGRGSITSTWNNNWNTSTVSADFDPFGRPRFIYPPDASESSPGHRVEMTYEGFRRIIRTVRIGTELDADAQTVTEHPVSRTEQYDAYGRLVAMTEPSGAGGSNVTTSYAYDVGDRLTQASTPVPGGHQTRAWSYDQRGFLNLECHPELGNGCTRYLDYNAMGQSTRVEDGPFVRKYTYDRAGGRLTTIQDGGNLLLKRLTYGRSSTASNRANGRLVQTINYQRPNLGQGTREQRFVEDFRYSGVGGARSYRKVSWVRECEPGETIADCLDDGFCDEESFEHSESFDPTGKLAGLTYPTCVSADSGCGPLHPRTVSYTYDPGSGFLTSIPGWVSDIRYHRNMTVQQVDHINGISDIIDEDPHHMSRPSAMRVMSGAEVLWESGTFRYDGAGNLLEMATTDWKDFFRYDGVSRLKESHQWIRRPPNQGDVIFIDGFETGGTSNWNDTDETFPVDRYTVQAFTHDVPGNLLSVFTDGNQVQHQVSSLTNRLTGNAAYDGAGNLTQFVDDTGKTTFTYDALKRLVRRDRAGHTTHFFYTADDERVLKFGSNGFEWALRDLSGRLLREFVPETGRIQPVRDHIYRGGGLVATVAADGNGNLTQVRHQSLDHLGSPRYITDGSGEYVSEHKYYPFGGEATQADQNDLPLKFTGHERDFYAGGSQDDLDYMHARYCAPRLGRFLSMDPVRGSPESPQSWNRFSYVRSNPMMFIDPDGRESAGIHLDNDAQDLLNGKISVAEYQQRIQARGTGALMAVSLLVPGVEDVAFAAASKLGVGARIGNFFRRLFGRVPEEIAPGQVASAYPKGRRVGGRREGVRTEDPPPGFQESGAWDLTPDNLARMERGQPPIGNDGLPVPLHHRNQNPAGPLDELSATTHRQVDHPLSPSRIDRKQFAGERRRYWVERARKLLGQD